MQFKYEILRGRDGLKFCHYNAIGGVSRNANQREIFQQILQSSKIDYYLCPHCIYTVVGTEYDILFRDIDFLIKSGNKIYITLIDGKRIEVNRQNFAIKCCLKKCCNPEATVNEYKPSTKKEDSWKGVFVYAICFFIVSNPIPNIIKSTKNIMDVFKSIVPQ